MERLFSLIKQKGLIARFTDIKTHSTDLWYFKAHCTLKATTGYCFYGVVILQPQLNRTQIDEQRTFG